MNPFLTILLLLTLNTASFALENDLNGMLSDLIRQDTTKGKRTVAVLPYTCTLEDEMHDAGRTVAEYTVAFLSNQGRYTVVDRMQFMKVAEELALSQSGIIDPEKALEAGKMLSADHIVTGNIGEVMGKRMISVQMIGVESGEVAAASYVTVGDNPLGAFIRDALSERAQRSSVIYRSLLAPGWGQFYTDHPVRGIGFSMMAVGAVGMLAWSGIDLSGKSGVVTGFDDMKNKPDGESLASYKARRQVAVDDRNAAFNQTVLFGGITAAVWVANIIDAAIVGGQEKKRVRQLYFSATPGMNGFAVSGTF